MPNARRLSADELCDALAAARAATLASAMDLTDEHWSVPYGEFIQPTAWDLGHVGWFAEFWLLRGPHRLNTQGYQEASERAQFFSPDENYDSANVVHTDRWKMPLSARDELRDRGVAISDRARA